MKIMDEKNLKNKLDKFVDKETPKCEGEECLIKTDKSLIEVQKLHKKVIIEDGRQLLT